MPGQNVMGGYESISEELKEQLEKERREAELKPEQQGGRETLEPVINRATLAAQYEALKARIAAGEPPPMPDVIEERLKEAEAKLQAAEEIRAAGETVESLEDRLNLIDEVSAEVDARQDQAPYLEVVEKFSAEQFKNDAEHYFRLAMGALQAEVAFFNATAVRGDREGDWLLSARITPKK